MRKNARFSWTMLAGIAVLAVAPLVRAGQASNVRQLITQPVNESQLTVLKGNTYPLAVPEFDRGPAPADLPMQRILMVLKRSPEQEAALTTLLAEQQDKNSPNYHHWLSPQEFGQQFGLSDADIQVITTWLESHGFKVQPVSNTRTTLEFSGNAGQVESAFHTSIHKYVVHGEEHWANNSDPMIPTALTPVVAGLGSLHNFFSKPFHHVGGVVTRSAATGQYVFKGPALGQSRADFTFTTAQGCAPFGGSCFAVGPADFATIYNLNALYAAGIDGTGQTVAVVGRSNIQLSDIATFRSLFGLPANVPNVILATGTDPGLVQNDETEAVLDVSESGAVAKNATIDLVTAPNVFPTDGVATAIMFAINHNVAPVLSVSFGNCELNLGTGGNAMLNGFWQSAMAIGITVTVSSGDSGAAGCDLFNPMNPAEQPALNGEQVSGFASTPFNVAVGGTDFDDFEIQNQFWSNTNAPGTESSALSYIPENPWNDSCANSVFFPLVVGGSTNMETNCNNPTFASTVNVVGGGGASGCINPTGVTPATCAGAYAKPTFQTGPGVPADGVRDVPDVSLFASNGFAGSFYVICETDATGGTCDTTTPDLLEIGGTSASAPSFAGIMTLVNQVGGPQGLPNMNLYNLAAAQTTANCNSTGATLPAATCVFNDVTTGGIQVPCMPGSTTNCVLSNNADTVAVLPGFSAGVGYDQATGLGSVNGFNLVQGLVPFVAVTLSANTLTFPSELPGMASTAMPITANNTGTNTLRAIVSFSGTNPADYTETDNCASVAAGASCTINVTFTPHASGASTATMNISGNITGIPETVAVSGTGSQPTTASLTGTITFTGANVDTASAVQVALLSNTGTFPLTVTSVTFTGTNAGDFSQTNTCNTAVAPGGTCTISVTFTPGAAGARTAVLNVTDNASGSPQTSNLSGTGEDFAVSATPTSNTVTAGQSATYTLTITAESGFSSAVNLACSGAPTGDTCNISQSSVNPGGTSATATVTLQTAAASVPPAAPHGQWPAGLSGALWLMAFLCCAFTLRRGLDRRARLGLGMATLLLLACAGCGSSSPAPQPVTSTLTLTGTSGGLTHTTTVSITVNP